MSMTIQVNVAIQVTYYSQLHVFTCFQFYPVDQEMRPAVLAVITSDKIFNNIYDLNCVCLLTADCGESDG